MKGSGYREGHMESDSATRGAAPIDNGGELMLCGVTAREWIRAIRVYQRETQTLSEDMMVREATIHMDVSQDRRTVGIRFTTDVASEESRSIERKERHNRSVLLSALYKQYGVVHGTRSEASWSVAQDQLVMRDGTTPLFFTFMLQLLALVFDARRD